MKQAFIGALRAPNPIPFTRIIGNHPILLREFSNYSPKYLGKLVRIVEFTLVLGKNLLLKLLNFVKVKGNLPIDMGNYP